MEWRLQDIARNLSASADQLHAKSDEVISLKFRPITVGSKSENEQSYFGGFEHQRIDEAFNNKELRGRVIIIQHETGPEIITRAAEWSSIAGLVISSWSIVWNYLISRKPDEPRGSDLSHVRVEVRKLRKDGSIREERVVDLELNRSLSETEVVKALDAAISKIGKLK